jgi:hypothetical protein
MAGLLWSMLRVVVCCGQVDREWTTLQIAWYKRSASS